MGEKKRRAQSGFTPENIETKKARIEQIAKAVRADMLRERNTDTLFRQCAPYAVALKAALREAGYRASVITGDAYWGCAYAPDGSLDRIGHGKEMGSSEGHCWVEIDGMIIDGMMPEYIAMAEREYGFAPRFEEVLIRHKRDIFADYGRFTYGKPLDVCYIPCRTSMTSAVEEMDMGLPVHITVFDPSFAELRDAA